jgi:hypothetical protein
MCRVSRLGRSRTQTADSEWLQISANSPGVSNRPEKSRCREHERSIHVMVSGRPKKQQRCDVQILPRCDWMSLRHKTRHKWAQKTKNRTRRGQAAMELGLLTIPCPKHGRTTVGRVPGPDHRTNQRQSLGWTHPTDQRAECPRYHTPPMTGFRTHALH